MNGSGAWGDGGAWGGADNAYSALEDDNLESAANHGFNDAFLVKDAMNPMKKSQSIASVHSQHSAYEMNTFEAAPTAAAEATTVSPAVGRPLTDNEEEYRIFTPNTKELNQILLKLVPRTQRQHWCLSYFWDVWSLKWIVLFEISFGFWIYSAEYDANQPKTIIIGIIAIIAILFVCLVTTVMIASEIRSRIRLFYAYLPLEIIILFDKTHPMKKKRFWFLTIQSILLFFLGLMIHNYDLTHLQLGITIFTSMILVTYDAMDFEKRLLPLHSFMARINELELKSGDMSHGNTIWNNFLAVDVTIMKAYVQFKKFKIESMMNYEVDSIYSNSYKKRKNRHVTWVYSRDDLQAFLQTEIGSNVINCKRYLRKVGGCCGKNNMRWAYGIPTGHNFTYK